ncbi:MAG: M56 family metallopeptidase [Gemmatimonadales bacterium]|nr:M56 family metallopeptidase [Gemmatimonadales bacterium]MYL05431.1 M56 family metallopeptidase [Gemmatimonadales bacterium]
MTDLALQIAGSKLAISIALGAVVWLVARGNERPRLCHALCLTLLAALLIPPLIGLPVLPPESRAAASAGAAFPAAAPSVTMTADDTPSVATSGVVEGGWFVEYGGVGLVVVWLLGASLVLVRTVAQMRSFRRSLRGASWPAPPQLQRMAAEIARTLGVAKAPVIRTTDAVISPMAYWSGGAVRVLVPIALLQSLKPTEMRWIIAHELAHVRRRDHLVRWLEWLACTVFWWNPVAWWARRRLRAAGEVCCDALVVRVFGCAPRAYAQALVRAIEVVRTNPTPPLPAFASAADCGHRTRLLEGRLRRIINHEPAVQLSPLLRLGLRCGLAVLLAFGLVHCSEQVSPTALEVPFMGAPLGDPSRSDNGGLGRGADYDAETGRLEWSLPSAPVIRAEEISWTHAVSQSAGGEDEPRPRRLVVVVGYDDEVEGPLSENDSFWAVADRAEDFPGTGVLFVQPTEDRGWRLLDRPPETSAGPYHITTFGPMPPDGWGLSMQAERRSARGAER